MKKRLGAFKIKFLGVFPFDLFNAYIRRSLKTDLAFRRFCTLFLDQESFLAYSLFQGRLNGKKLVTQLVVIYDS